MWEGKARGESLSRFKCLWNFHLCGDISHVHARSMAMQAHACMQLSQLHNAKDNTYSHNKYVLLMMKLKCVYTLFQNTQFLH